MSRGLGDVYKRQYLYSTCMSFRKWIFLCKFWRLALEVSSMNKRLVKARPGKKMNWTAWRHKAISKDNARPGGASQNTYAALSGMSNCFPVFTPEETPNQVCILSFSHQDSAQRSERLPFLLLFSLCFLPILKGLQLSLVRELSYSISLRMSQAHDKYKDCSSKQLS